MIEKADHHIDKTSCHQTTTGPGHSLKSAATTFHAQYNCKHHYQKNTGIGIIIDNFAAELIAQQHHNNKRTTCKLTIVMLGSSTSNIATQIQPKNHSPP